MKKALNPLYAILALLAFSVIRYHRPFFMGRRKRILKPAPTMGKIRFG